VPLLQVGAVAVSCDWKGADPVTVMLRREDGGELGRYSRLAPLPQLQMPPALPYLALGVVRGLAADGVGIGWCCL
jgi:hypothetical protein